jgi:outer membrane protein OmpA-like peptidoglycan-associated protein
MAFLQPFVTRLSVGLTLFVWTIGAQAWAQQEREGWSLDRHTVVLGADSDRVYLGLAQEGVTLNEALRQEWKVLSAPRLGGDLVEERVRPLQVEAWNALKNIQHVAVHPDGGMAVISARRGEDDLDVFVSHRSKSRVPGGRAIWSAPMPLDGLNSEADEVFPQWNGRDITFSSDRSGSFVLYTARAATQWLRAERHAGLDERAVDVLSALTVGPGWTWVSRRPSPDAPVQVVREDWPQPKAALEAGWSVCVTADGGAMAGQVLAVRDPSTRNVVRRMTTGPDGCAELAGLPADRVWTFQWQREESATPAGAAVAEVRAPDGRVVRRYDLSAASGWEFVFLPLDPVAEIRDRRAQDGSTWPTSTLAILSYEHGSPTPTPESWRTFLTWAKGIQQRPEQGVLHVTGHTDASGTDDVNAALSLARAEYVATQCQALAKWPEERVEVRALGSAQPLSDDPAQNRRVEVRWVPAMQ